MNDPNGLVFYSGEYHMFYQHNPFENTWGHMSWGHAVSSDLTHWEHLPVALYEANGIMIFSGSAVVDWKNTSGFGTLDEPALVAIYTGHSAMQTQNIAFSTDRGRTWQKYTGNPVIDIGSSEFRDPNVFWHAPGSQWIMLTVLSDQFKVRFDGSPDLKNWKHLSDFGPAGNTAGLWECPDLFQLPVADQPGTHKWVLKVDVQHSIGAQYFIGEFDGCSFAAEPGQGDGACVDYGVDFYAAQSWSDSPDGRRIWIGWLSNWNYTRDIPTAPWRGLFSIPRELFLKQSSHGFHLIQKPITELRKLRQTHFHSAAEDIDGINTQLAQLTLGSAIEIKLEFSPGTTGKFGLAVRVGAGEETIIGYDAQAQELFLDRRRSGEHSFYPDFGALHSAALLAEQGKIRLHIFVDSCSVEIFGNDGLVTITDLIVPDQHSQGMRIYCHESDACLETLDFWRLGG